MILKIRSVPCGAEFLLSVMLKTKQQRAVISSLLKMLPFSKLQYMYSYQSS